MIELREKEIWRYLGYRATVPDPDMRAQISRCADILQRECMPKYIMREFPMEIPEDGQNRENTQDDSAPAIIIHDLTIASRNLAYNLKGCEKVLLFAATLGHAPDRLIKRASVSHISDAVICQAAAAEMIEAYCDMLNNSWKEQYGQQGWILHPRFSPGYGDLPLEIQRDVIRILNTPKEIGLTLTDTLIMLPSKSVTAFIGLERKGAGAGREDAQREQACDTHTGGCESCTLTDCLYKK